MAAIKDSGWTKTITYGVLSEEILPTVLPVLEYHPNTGESPLFQKWLQSCTVNALVHNALLIPYEI